MKKPILLIPFMVAMAAHMTSPAIAQKTELREAVANDYRERLAALFDHFHRNPELSGREEKTAARMATELRALGYEVTSNVGGHGVVAVLKNGTGPTILLRADMDGLPVEERSGLPNPSRARQVDAQGVEQPVMHACGHDIHITSLVGAARQLIARRALWSGTLVLVAQPAEEIVAGARAMIADGLYTRFPKPDVAVGFHVGSALPAGRINVPLGIAYSSVDTVQIEVKGVGTHGAYPHLGVDPVMVASQIVVSLQTMLGRQIDPLQGALITVGSFQGGVKANIIPERAVLQMTVRTDSPQIRQRVLDGIDQVARGTALALGVPETSLPIVTRSPTETTPPVINDKAAAETVRAAFAARMGEARLIDVPRSGMGGEDFAYYATPENGVKGVFFNVGGTPEPELEKAPPHHSPLFRVAADQAVPAGVEAMVIAAETLLARR